MSNASLADVSEESPVVTEVAQDEETAAAQAPLLPRHPAVFVALGGFPLLAFASFGFTGQGAVAAFASAVLVALAAIDIEHRVLPNRIVVPAAAFLLVAQVAFFPDRALEWLLAGFAASVFLALPLVIRRDAMGMGDIKLAFLLGVATGWSVFGAITIGCFAMVPVALWMLFRKQSIRNATLPFGPFLALGTLVILFTA
jgi:leader peptidase (prepilin peptidase)/N-methyltransferase